VCAADGQGPTLPACLPDGAYERTAALLAVALRRPGLPGQILCMRDTISASGPFQGAYMPIWMAPAARSLPWPFSSLAMCSSISLALREIIEESRSGNRMSGRISWACTQ
jgi:hypothetical protein